MKKQSHLAVIKTAAAIACILTAAFPRMGLADESITGENGDNGTEISPDGEDGEDVTAPLMGPDDNVTATGGNGGWGFDEGAGGHGGDATAVADVSAQAYAGNVGAGGGNTGGAAIATVVGGKTASAVANGGGGLRGQNGYAAAHYVEGGHGGDGTATASAAAIDNTGATATATAEGGSGGHSLHNKGGSPGIGIANAYAESDYGGSVNVTGSVLGGSAGDGLESDVTASPYNGASVSIEPLQIGGYSENGNLSLTATATGGNGGSRIGEGALGGTGSVEILHESEKNEARVQGSSNATGGAGELGGDAIASTTLFTNDTASTTKLEASASAFGGNGSGSNYDYSGSGASVTQAIAVTTNTGHGEAISTASATGGDALGAGGYVYGGNFVGIAGIGGAAEATATATSADGAATATASASGGSGGTASGIDQDAGSGNTATANAIAESVDGLATATATATGGNAGAAFDSAGAIGTGGIAYATAEATSTNGSALATATGTGGYNDIVVLQESNRAPAVVSATATSGVESYAYATANSVLVTAHEVASSANSFVAIATATANLDGLNFELSGSTITVESGGGAYLNQAGGTVTATTSVTVSSGSNYDLGGGTLTTPSLVNNGSLNYSGGTVTGTTITGTGSTTVTDDTLYVAGGIRQASLEISNGAVVDIDANGGSFGVSDVATLTIAPVTGGYDGLIDLHDNDLVIDYDGGSSPYATVVAQVKSGLTLLGGDGTGIGSSEVDAQTVSGTRLGVVDNGAAFGLVTSLSGYSSFSSDSVVVKYTWVGDANLDGVVNGSDYALVDTGWGTNQGWFYGDFNYDGITNGSDYALIDTGFSAQTGALPEPATLGLLGLSAMGILRRRRGC